MSWTSARYPSYRETGYDWLPFIPAHWDIRRSRFVFRETDQRSIDGRETHLSMTQTRGLIPSSNLNKKGLQSATYAGGKLVRTGDLVLNRLKAHLGVFAGARQPGIISPDYSVFRSLVGRPVEYYEKLFKTPMYVGELRRSTRGIVEGFWRLYTDDFYNIPALLPPPEEQDQIVAYLRVQDAQIARFIRDKRRLIEVLNEQKQTLIHRAVTRGLDTKARLKPSGIEWLDEVPTHWIVKPLKHWARINECTLTDNTDEDYAFRYIDIGTVKTGRLVGEPKILRFKDAPSRARRVLRKGDTIISTVRTYLRAIWSIADEAVDLIASTGFAVLTPRKGVDPTYLSYVVQSDSFINRVTASSIGIAYPAIAETVLGRFHIALPPTVDEQTALVRWIEETSKPLNEGIAQAEEEISLMRQYRDRLIADVVTGQIDVRGWVPGPDDVIDEAAVILADEDETMGEPGAEDDDDGHE